MTLTDKLLGVIVSLFLVNRIGRRPLLISTGIFMTATDIVIGAIGIKRDRTENENTAIVAMIMLYVFAFNLAWVSPFVPKNERSSSKALIGSSRMGGRHRIVAWKEQDQDHVHRYSRFLDLCLGGHLYLAVPFRRGPGQLGADGRVDLCRRRCDFSCKSSALEFSGNSLVADLFIVFSRCSCTS